MDALARENVLVLSLVQAMIGAVSTNFRRVSIGTVGSIVRIQFILQEESADDREEIADIEFEFSVLVDPRIDTEVEVVVSEHPLWQIPALKRLVFARRET